MDAVITTQSTAILESMLAGLPVAVLDYNNCPHYVRAAWNIFVREHIPKVVSEMANPAEHKMLFQRDVLNSALLYCEESDISRDRAITLIKSMLSLAKDCGESMMEFPARMLAAPRPQHISEFDHSQLYPQFAEFSDPATCELQTQLAHARREIEHLNGQLKQAKAELGDAHEIFEQIHRHPIAGPIVRTRQKFLDWVVAMRNKPVNSSNGTSKSGIKGGASPTVKAQFQTQINNSMIRELGKLELARTSLKTTDPIVLCAADENYAKSLAVTLHTAATRLGSGKFLNVILLDGGLSEESWVGLEETLAGLPIELHAIKPDLHQINDLNISHHITHTAYFRLLAAKLLPDWIDKVIYLDSDLLIRDDVSRLWEMELGDGYCLAAPDIACPIISAKSATANVKLAIPYMAAVSPVRNWKQLGLDPAAPYFNSGVMVLNLARWRDEMIENELLNCLRDNEKDVWCWDQYALNVVFAGQWKALPTWWNQGAHVFEYPSDTHSPIAVDEFRRMKSSPSIIHFTTEWKPWHFRPFNPNRELFYEALDNTAWKGWRPVNPGFSIFGDLEPVCGPRCQTCDDPISESDLAMELERNPNHGNVQLSDRTNRGWGDTGNIN